MAEARGTEGRFFFGEDQDGKWYLIPEGMRGEWIHATEDYIESDSDMRAFNDKFAQFRSEASPHSYSIVDPVLASKLFDTEA